MISLQKLKKLFCLGLLALALLLSGSWLWQEQQQRAVAAGAPVYHGNSGKGQVAICINVDWGEDFLPGMLETLTQYDAKATFFLTGRWTEKFPDMAKEIKAAGMEIGNHGLKHSSPNGMTYEENVADIRAAEEKIEAALHIHTALFAPAAGEIDAQVQKAAEDLGYTLILWSVDTIDWQKPSPEMIVERVAQKVEDGSIILMHPTENTAAALDDILAVLAEKELKPVPVSELLK